MKNNTQQPFYLIIHIPKAAGTTLRYILDQTYGPENVLTYYNQTSTQLLENLDAHLKVHPNYKAIIGHFTFGLHNKIEIPSKYITFLRHPVARTISQYNETLVNHRQFLQGKNGSILNLAESIENNPEYYEDNQTKQIVGDDPRCAMGSPRSEVALDILDKHFDGIGLVEYFDQSIALMSRNLGWRAVEYRKLNVKGNDIEVTPGLIEKINSLNENDIKLYESVEKKLLEDFETMKPQR